MIGRHIHQYVITEKLGQGGMGVVYKADDTRLRRTVALKFLHPSVVVGPEQAQRLVDEARAAAGLSHPNICTVYEINEFEGRTFIAMQYVEGSTLRDRVLSGRIDVPEALRFLIEIADGLAEAHRKGVVHRDMKSSNVMITPGDRAVIMDFGLARRAGQVHPDDRFSSRSASAYMSPEHARGAAIDQRTDIWSLGVVLYEMLAGQLPFRGEHEQAVIASILNDAPRPIDELKPGLPPAVARIVDRCLRKDARQRYQSLDELMAALRGALASVSGAAPQRHRGRIGTAGVAVAAVLTLVAALVTHDFLRGRRAGGQERVPIAVIDFNNETEEPSLEGLSGMLITALEQSRRLQVMTRSRMFDVLSAMGEKNVTRIDESLGQRICDASGVDALVIPTIRRFGDLYVIDLKVLDTRQHRYLFTAKHEGRGQESIPHMIDTIARSIRIDLRDSSDAVARTLPVGEVTTADLAAYQAYFEGEALLDRLDFDGAGKSFRRAIAMDSTFALAYYRLAYTEWWSRGRQDIARTHVAYAVRNLGRIPPKERFLVRALSAALHDGFAAQLSILKEMRRLYPDDKEMWFGLGDAEFHSGSIDSSVVHFRSALALDPAMERALQHLAWAYQREGLDQQALAAARRWVDAAQSIEAYEFLAGCYARLGKLDDAVRALDVARARAPDNPVVPIRMAGILFAQRRPEAAEQQAAQAERMLARGGGFYARGELWRLRSAVLYPYYGRYHDVDRLLDESIGVLSQGAADSTSIVAIEIGRAELRYWAHQDAGRVLAELERLRGAGLKYARAEYVRATIVFGLLAGDSTRAGSVERAYGRDLTPRGRKIVAAVHSLVEDDCAGIVRSVSPAGDAPDGARVPVEIVHYLSAVCQLEGGRADLAIPELIAIVDAPLLNPDAAPVYPPAYFQLGRAYEAAGEARRALSAYESLLALWKDADADLVFRTRAEARVRALRRAM